MNKKLFTSFAIVTSLLITSNSAFADFAFVNESDFTGDAFFSPTGDAQVTNVEKPSKEHEVKHATPPLKNLRLKIQRHHEKIQQQNSELAPMPKDVYAADVGYSEYASQEVNDDFDEIVTPDGFEADEEVLEETEQPKKSFFKKFAKEPEEPTENIILDCERVDYDTDNYIMKAHDNVTVTFVKQNAVVKADLITFDRLNNTLKAEGNVKILKNGKTVTGDYIFVDMNEENALIENPITTSTNIEIKSKRGYVYGDKIVQEEGSVEVNEPFPIEFTSAGRGPQIQKMYTPKNETLSDDMENGLVRVKVKDLKITQKGDLETIAVKKGRIFKGNKTLLKVPSLKVYTNKTHDYAETSSWELGSYRGLGMYVGPGVVFELPKGSVLKVMPILNYKSGFGIGGIGRFSSGTNQTQVAYGTAASKFIVSGKQQLDDNLFLQYGMNSYMDEWFLGRRRPKYGVNLVYNRAYSSNDFFLKNRPSSFAHRLEAGYFNDLDFDKNYEELVGSDMGTMRFRYMLQGTQNLFSYENEEEMKSLRFDVTAQLSSALYGTGDTQVIGRVGPVLHTQYKRWMQDIGYFITEYSDHSPMPVFDAYRYGKQNIYLREYFRLWRYLTVCWFGSITLTGDSPNGDAFQENAFYISIGPDDLKFNIGYDFVRENTYFTVQVLMDAKGTHLDYDKLEIKQDKKSQEDKKAEEQKEQNSFQAAPDNVLQRAVVEDVKVYEDVL